MTDNAPILITGGAGYIGSHAVLAFQDAGYSVVVVDDLSSGRRDAVPSSASFVEGDVADERLMRNVFEEYHIGSVVHFAGSIIVPESVAEPLKYYRNNTSASLTLIEACVRSGIEHFIFSSTASVYGRVDNEPIAETAIANPINPYGVSKLMIEWMLRDTAAAHNLGYVALRYFNVAGADPKGRAGQSKANATHLIKIACQAVLGRRGHINVYGGDYDTPDGTAIRDYVHVSDLAGAHVDALRYLHAGGSSLVLNCGYGHGYSVTEVLDAIQADTGSKLDIRMAARRPGDNPCTIADNTAIRECFGWQPQYDDLQFIIKTAIDWERRISESV